MKFGPIDNFVLLMTATMTPSVSADLSEAPQLRLFTAYDQRSSLLRCTDTFRERLYIGESNTRESSHPFTPLWPPPKNFPKLRKSEMRYDRLCSYLHAGAVGKTSACGILVLWCYIRAMLSHLMAAGGHGWRADGARWHDATSHLWTTPPRRRMR